MKYVREYKDAFGIEIQKGDIVSWLEDGESREQAIARYECGKANSEKVYEWYSDGQYGLGFDSTYPTWIECGKAYPCQYGIYPISDDDLQDIVVVSKKVA